VVDTLITDEKGEATSISLAIGVYTLHQIKGDPKHEMMEDEDVVLIKSDVHKTVTFGPYKDDENKIRIELVKRSSETKKLLNDAVYEIYDEDQDIVATLTTGTWRWNCRVLSSIWKIYDQGNCCASRLQHG